MKAAEYVQQLPQGVKGQGDVVALVALVTSWLNVLSTFLTIVVTILAGLWWLTRLLESPTVQAWLAKRRAK